MSKFGEWYSALSKTNADSSPRKNIFRASLGPTPCLRQARKQNHGWQDSFRQDQAVRKSRRRIPDGGLWIAQIKECARIFYSMLKNGKGYVDLGQDYYEKQYRDRVTKSLQKRPLPWGSIWCNERRTIRSQSMYYQRVRVKLFKSYGYS